MRISDWSSDVCSSDLLGRPSIDAGEHQLRGAVHRDIEESFAAFVAQFGDIDVEIADLVLLELLRLLAIRLRQSADPVPLQAAVKRRARQVRDHVLQRDEDVIERQPRSEEHTSELQSLMRISYAVFCLKKKKTDKNQRHNHH